MEDGLPEGWAETTLGELGSWGSGGTPPRTNAAYYSDAGIPWLVIGDLNDGVVYSAKNHITELGLRNSAAKLLDPGILLVAMYGSIGKLGITGVQCATNQAIAFCLPDKELTSLKYLYYSLKNEQGALIAQGQGGAQQNISQTILKAHPVPLPPLPEQRRIADKLDVLLSRVEAGRERLERVPKLLKKFRQAVLSAATSGELTREWRGGGDAEWRHVELGQIAEIQGGITKDAKKQSVSDPEWPYLRAANVQRGYLDLHELKTIRIPTEKAQALLLVPGDVLFMEGGDKDKVGRGWVWEGQVERCVYQNHVFRARLIGRSIHPKYISWWGNYQGIDYFLESGKQTTGIASISKNVLSHLPIALPPSSEQVEIVRRVEALFALADSLEARAKTALASYERLTPALLAKAFRGELVAQNPQDEPASVLLERIRAGREAEGGAKKAGGRGRGKEAAPRPEVPEAAAPARRGRGRPPRDAGREIPSAASAEDAIAQMQVRREEREEAQAGLFD